MIPSLNYVLSFLSKKLKFGSRQRGKKFGSFSCSAVNVDMEQNAATNMAIGSC